MRGYRSAAQIRRQEIPNFQSTFHIRCFNYHYNKRFTFPHAVVMVSPPASSSWATNALSNFIVSEIEKKRRSYSYLSKLLLDARNLLYLLDELAQ